MPETVNSSRVDRRNGKVITPQFSELFAARDLPEFPKRSNETRE